MQLLGSMKLTVGVLGALVVLVFAGTIYQIDAGVYRAVEEIFSPWFITLLPVPLPGGQLLLWLFAVNLGASFFGRLRWVRPKLGLLIGHAGLLVLLAAALAGLYGSNTYVLALEEGSADDRVYLRDSWDAVLYDPFDFTEFGRVPVAGGEDLVFEIDGHQLRVPVIEYSRNSRRVDDAISGGESADAANDALSEQAREPAARAEEQAASTREPAAPAEEQAANIPLLRVGLPTSLPEGYRLLATSNLELAGSDQRPTDFLYAEGRGPVGIFLEPTSIALPFSLMLEDFEAVFYPGTETPSSFSSSVLVEPAGFRARISMNTPLRYQDYTFYQSSYRLADPSVGLPRDLTVLAVRHASLPWLAYLGTIVTVLGILLHFVQRWLLGRRSGRVRPEGGGKGADMGRKGASLGVFLVIFLFASANLLTAQTTEELVVPRPASDELSQMMLQIGGRWMPGARAAVLFTSQLDVRGQSDLDFLVLATMSPGQADTVPAFRVDNPAVFAALQLPYRERGRYSFNELRGGFQILNQISDVIDQLAAAEDRRPDPLEAELIRLSQQSRLYLQVRGSLNPPALGQAGLEQGRWSQSLFRMFPLEARLEQTAIAEAFHPLEARRLAGSPAYGLLADDAHLEAAAELVSEGVPPLEPETWQAYLAEIRSLQEQYLDQSRDTRGLEHYRTRRAAERVEIRWNPQAIGMGMAGLALFAIGPWAYFRGRSGLLRELQERIVAISRTSSTSAALGAGLFLLFDLVLRILVTQRPPVTDLSSSMLFVAWISISASAFGRPEKAGGLGLRVGGLFLGLILGLLSAYFAGQGDRFAVLPAILDTNFWLTIHVITIALGYAAVLLAGVLGNAYIIRINLNPRNPGIGLHRAMTQLLLAGLVLSFFGTMLGGFWADQAWGRFWGWDPKENGALMIVLWTALVLHLGPAGVAGNYGIAIGAAAGVLVTAFSWFGVNMIGVGLHSYGFNARALYPLVSIGILQGMVILAALAAIPRIRKASLLPEERLGRIVARRRLSSDTCEVLIEAGTYAGIRSAQAPGSAPDASPGPASAPAADHGQSPAQLPAADSQIPSSTPQPPATAAGPSSSPPSIRPGSRLTLGMDLAGRLIRRVFSIAGVVQLKEGLAYRVLVRDSGNRGLSRELVHGSGRRRLRIIGPTGGTPLGKADTYLCQGLGIAAFLPLFAAGGPVRLVWAVRGWDEEPLIPEVLRLLDERADIEMLLLLPQGQEGRDQLPQRSEVRFGRLDAELVQELRSSGAASFAAAGSSAFVRDMEQLVELAWSEEFVDSRPGNADLQDRTALLRKSPKGRPIAYRVPAGSTLMDAVLAAGGEFPRQCAAGQCRACRFRLQKGRVLMADPNSLGRAYAEAGEEALGCVAYPLEDCEVVVSDAPATSPAGGWPPA